jgi:glycosyltransferase involved in cell wall biosynthesis
MSMSRSIVVDDASTDGTAAWLATHYAGRAVRVLDNRGCKGPAGGRNTGMRAATGELVALLDSDDTYLPGHLAAAVDAFERFPELGLVFGRASYVRDGRPDDYMGPLFERKLASAPATHRDDGLIVFGPDFFDHLLQYGCWFNLSTVVMRNELAQLGMNESLRVAEDYEFWVRLAQKHRFGCLLRPQIRYLLHDDNISFETTGTAAENAPSLLVAYQSLVELPTLSSGSAA